MKGNIHTHSNSSFILKAMLALTGAYLAYLAITKATMASPAVVATAFVAGAAAESVVAPILGALLLLLALSLLLSGRRKTYYTAPNHDYIFYSPYPNGCQGTTHTHHAAPVYPRGPVVHQHENNHNHTHHHSHGRF